jgi:hypothetical protein
MYNYRTGIGPIFLDQSLLTINFSIMIIIYKLLSIKQ